MTRLYTEGFEAGDILGLNVSAGDIQIISTSPRSGSYCIRTSGVTAIGTILLSDISEVYLRFGFKYYTNRVEPRLQWLNGSTVLGHIRVNNNGAVSGVNAYSSTGTLLANATINLSYGVWYLVEMYIKIGDAPNGRIITKIDGVTDIDFTGDTQPAALTTINKIELKGQGGGGDENYFDDIGINNILGTSDNSWCGDGHIIGLLPDEAGSVTQLIPSSGSSNWSLVDERPYNTTDYVSGSVVGQYDLYNLTAFPIQNAEIKRVWTESRSLDTVASGGTISIGLKADGETEDWSDDIQLLTSYSGVKGRVYKTTPSGSATWTKDNLDTLQLGIKTGI